MSEMTEEEKMQCHEIIKGFPRLYAMLEKRQRPASDQDLNLTDLKLDCPRWIRPEPNIEETKRSYRASGPKRIEKI